MQNLFKILIPLLSLPGFIITGCRKVKLSGRGDTNISSQPAIVSRTQAATPLIIDLVPFWFHIEDQNMTPLTNDSDLIWDMRGHTPIIAPDGHQVTFAEFSMVSGKAEIRCTDQQTKVDINVQGLIPAGTYSCWVLTFKLPGFLGTFDNLVSTVALGPDDGSMNTFTASAGGIASYSAIENFLCSEYEVLILATYHTKNFIQPGIPGKADSSVGQFAFLFRGD